MPEQKDEEQRRLRDERVELLKRKQGLTEEEPVERGPRVVPVQLGPKARMENFFYRNGKKLPLFGVFLIAIVVWMVVESVSKVRPDVEMLIAVTDVTMTMEQAEEVFTGYVTDVNGDGKRKVDVTYVQMSQNVETADPNMVMANVARLAGSFQSDTVYLMLLDKQTMENQQVEESGFFDLRELLPGNPQVTSYGYTLEGSPLAEELGLTEVPEGLKLYLFPGGEGTSRDSKKATRAFEASREMLLRIVNGEHVASSDEAK